MENLLGLLFGRRPYVIDPLDILKQGGARNRLNPFALLHPEEPYYEWRVNAMADALIEDDATPGFTRFFTQASRVVVAGLIDAVIRADIFQAHEKNLVTVRELALTPQGLPSAIMAGLGGMAASCAAMHRRGSARTFDEVICTVIAETRWLDLPAFKWALSGPDFAWKGKSSVQLVLPAHYQDQCKRFERVLIVALNEVIPGAVVESYGVRGVR